ncbi:MAG: putative ABC transporter permease, partial [Spirochaetota bacterium]
NRSMFHGHIPLYGFAGLALARLDTCITSHLSMHPALKALLFFVLATVVATVFEYSTGKLQRTFFGIVSWDYSSKPFNVEGIICLQVSLLWGFLACLFLYVFDAPYTYLADDVLIQYRYLAVPILLFMAADTVYAAYKVEKLHMLFCSYSEEKFEWLYRHRDFYREVIRNTLDGFDLEDIDDRDRLKEAVDEYVATRFGGP